MAGLARHGRLRPRRRRVAAPLGRGLRRLGGRRKAPLDPPAGRHAVPGGRRGGAGRGSSFREDWPAFDEAAIAAEEKEFAVQINGKTRRTFMALPEAGREELLEKARRAAVDYIGGKEVVKEIVVPGRLVNIVVKG